MVPTAKYGIKLPRKRKKAYLKAKGYQDYVTACIINEILVEEKDIPKNRGFYDYRVKKHRVIIIKKY